MLAFCITLLLSISTQAQGPPGGNGPPLWKLSGNSISSGDFLGTTNNMPLIIKTNGTEHLRLLSSGELGIGTSSPQYQLDVAGSFRVSDTAFLNATRIGGPFYLQDGSQGNGKVLTSNGQGKASWTEFGQISYWEKSGNDLYSQGVKVGIGTNNPLKAFDVNGDALVRETLYVNEGLQIGNVLEADSNETRISSRACVDGRFGIGTTSPSEKLTVKGNARIHGRTTTDSLKVHGRTEFGYATFDSLKVGDSSIVIGNSNNVSSVDGALKINVETSSKGNPGNVGIGTDDPQKKLHVKTFHGKIPGFGSHEGIRLENVEQTLGPPPTGGSKSTVKYDIEPALSLPGGNKGLRFKSPQTSKKALALYNSGNASFYQNVGIGTKPDNDTMLSVAGKVQIEGNTKILGGSVNRSFSTRLYVNAEGSDEWVGVFKNPAGDGNGILVEGGVGSSGGNHTLLQVQRNKGIDTSEQKQVIFKVNGENGITYAREVKVNLDNWPDRVFDKGYRSPSLAEEKAFVRENGHLKGIPTEKKLLENDLPLGEMARLQQREIEEVYLHLFEMKETIEAQAKAIESKKGEVDQKEKEIELLRERNEMLEEEVELLKEMLEKRTEQKGE